MTTIPMVRLEPLLAAPTTATLEDYAARASG